METRFEDVDREIRAMKRVLLELEQRTRSDSEGVQERAQLRQDVEALKSLVDQIASREGVTLHRLETLKERIDEVVALGREVEALKGRLPADPKAPGAALSADAVAMLREEMAGLRQEVELSRAAQGSLGRRLDALKEEGQKTRNQMEQIEAQAHAALEEVRKQVALLQKRPEQAPREGPPPPRPLPIRRSDLTALRERAAQVGEVDPGPETRPPRKRR